MDPATSLRTLLGALAALRKGAVYGVKVRLPHSLVSGAVFSRGGPGSEPLTILRKALAASFEHGRNLALFAFAYKLALLGLRMLKDGAQVRALLEDPTLAGKPAQGWHALVAGGLGAYLVWKKPTAVNLQICLYLLSRVLIGWARVLASKGVAPFCYFESEQVMPPLIVATWASVMYLWEEHRSLLIPSLARSMDEIYRPGTAAEAAGAGTVAAGGVDGGGGGGGGVAAVVSAALKALRPSPATLLVLAYGILNGLPLLPT